MREKKPDGVQLNERGSIASPSGSKAKPKELESGQTYLSKNLWSYRTIVGVMGDRVLYVDEFGKGQCSSAHFVQKCPTVATETEKKVLKVDENSKRLASEALVLRDDHRTKAMIIGKVVRDALEGFHVKHISDKDMPELNQTVRNSVATALHMLDYSLQNEQIAKILGWHVRSMPSYWESPELLDDYFKAIHSSSDPRSGVE